LYVDDIVFDIANLTGNQIVVLEYVHQGLVYTMEVLDKVEGSKTWYKPRYGIDYYPDQTFEYRLSVLVDNTFVKFGSFFLTFTQDLKPPPNATLNFPGIEGVTVQAYVNGVWQFALEELFDDTSGLIRLPAGTTSVRAIKAGMYYQIDGLKINDYGWYEFDIPVGTIVVEGVTQPCQLAIVQNDWVYKYSPAIVGAPNYFNVFDNGKTYELRLLRTDGVVKQTFGINANQNVWAVY
jgi:hypothetical protein